MRLLILLLLLTCCLTYSQNTNSLTNEKKLKELQKQTCSSVDYDCISQKLKDFFYYYHNLSEWIEEDKSVSGDYEYFIYRQSLEENSMIVEIFSRPKEGTTVLIKEYFEKRDKLCTERSFILEEDGAIVSPQFSFLFSAHRVKKSGKTVYYGKENGAFVKEQCDQLKRVNKDDIFISAFNEAKAICSIVDLYNAFP